MLKHIFLLLLVLLTPSFTSSKVVTIAGTADLQGIMEPAVQKFDLDNDGKTEKVKMGGAAYLSTIYKELKKENPNVVIVSTGDDLMNRYFQTYKGKAIFSLLSAAGIELYAFGNHEFDKGNKVLADALKEADFTALCSDLDVSSSALNGMCTPYIIKEIEGVKVGFFSLMTEDLPMVTSEKEVKLVADNVSMARMMVKLLKEKGADVIVALTHIGYKQDAALAKQVKGIDLIFGGHSHAYVKRAGHIGKTTIVNGGEQGTYVIKVEIPLDKRNRVISKEIKMTKIAVTTMLEPDPKIVARIEEYRKNFPASIVLGKTEKPWDLTSDTLRKGESSVADMINDLMREKFKVDIVLNNAGAFRGGKIYPEGNITDTMLKEIDEFGNYAYIFKLKGKYFKEILERSAANYAEGGLMQVSGLRYRIRLSRKLQKIDGRHVIAKGERVDHIEVLENGKWVPLDEKKVYRVLSNSFLVNDQGDGYFWFKKYGKEMKNTFTTFYAIMAEFIEHHKILSPKQKDGRLEIVHQ
jgi:5'-nucleotidase